MCVRSARDGVLIECSFFVPGSSAIEVCFAEFAQKIRSER
jgi:hypothetical protein